MLLVKGAGAAVLLEHPQQNPLAAGFAQECERRLEQLSGKPGAPAFRQQIQAVQLAAAWQAVGIGRIGKG